MSCAGTSVDVGVTPNLILLPRVPADSSSGLHTRSRCPYFSTIATVDVTTALTILHVLVVTATSLTLTTFLWGILFLDSTQCFSSGVFYNGHIFILVSRKN
jgi:hypothetical protein